MDRSLNHKVSVHACSMRDEVSIDVGDGIRISMPLSSHSFGIRSVLYRVPVSCLIRTYIEPWAVSISAFCKGRCLGQVHERFFHRDRYLGQVHERLFHRGRSLG
jgi:hypothetical protein